MPRDRLAHLAAMSVAATRPYCAPPSSRSAARSSARRAPGGRKRSRKAVASSRRAVASLVPYCMPGGSVSDRAHVVAC